MPRDCVISRRLVAVQRPGLQEDVIGHADDADVVEQGGDFQQIAVFPRHVHLLRPRRAGQRDAESMPGRRRVLALQRREEAAGDAQPKAGQAHFRRLVVRPFRLAMTRGKRLQLRSSVSSSAVQRCTGAADGTIGVFRGEVIVGTGIALISSSGAS